MLKTLGIDLCCRSRVCESRDPVETITLAGRSEGLDDMSPTITDGLDNLEKSALMDATMYPGDEVDIPVIAG